MTQDVGIEFRDADYYLENADEFDALTQAQQIELMSNGKVEVEAEDQAANDATQQAQADEQQQVNQDAQQEAARYRTLADQQSAIIAQLTEAKKADATNDGGGTAAQNNVLAELSEEYPELAEKLAPAISKMVTQGVSDTVKSLKAEFEAALKPLQERAQLSEVELHFNAIRAVHPDLDVLTAGDAIDKWIEWQPAFVQGRYQDVLNSGSATEVNELLNVFKASQSQTSQQIQGKAQLQTQARDAVRKAITNPPVSLSDVPAASVKTGDESSALSEMSSNQLWAAMNGKSPEQIEAMLSKLEKAG